MRQIRHSRTKPPAGRLEARSLQWGLVAALLLGSVGVAVYANSFRTPLVFDAAFSIRQNPAVQRIWPWICCRGGDHAAGANRPFGFLTFALNYAWGGYDVWGYHAVNLAIHLAAAWLLFDILRRTLSQGRLATRFAAHAWGLALAVALAWLVHPLQTNAVTYVYQRLESIMGLCYLATLWCFSKHLNSPRSSWWLVASVISCALGMATKEVMVTAPVIVLWYDRVFAASSWRELIQVRGKYYAALAGTWGLLAWLMYSSRVAYATDGVLFVPGVSPLEYAQSQPAIVLHYLRLAFWPDQLCLDYCWPVARAAGEVVPPLLVIGALVALSAWSAWRWPAVGFLGGWFFLILAPTSSIAPLKDLAFEHRMYLPLAAVVALVVLFSYQAGQYVMARFPALNRSRWMAQPISIIVLLAALMALGWRTVKRNEDYRSNVSIWRNTAEQRPRNARAHRNLGKMLMDEEDDLPGAIRETTLAIDLEPDEFEGYYNRGRIYASLHQLEAAIADFSRAIELQPEAVKAYFNRGSAYAGLQKYQSAVADYTRAIRLQGDLPVAFCNRGRMYAQLALKDPAQYPLALADFAKAIELKPDYADVYLELGSTHDRLHQPELAVRDYTRAIDLSAGDADTFFKRGNAFNTLGRRELAVQDYTRAVLLQPRFAGAYYNRGETYFGLGKFDRALGDFNQALRLNPKYVAALTARARLFAACPDPRYRNPSQAVADATGACSLTDWKNEICLETLSAACANQGDFQQAMQWQSAALALRPSDQEYQQAGRQRLELLRAGKNPFQQQSKGK